MTSLFATGVKRRNSPAWCKKGMYPKILPVVDGLPAALTAYARWHELSSGREAYLIETFQLHRVTGSETWYGDSYQYGSNLAVLVDQVPTTETYHLTLYLRLDQLDLDNVTWPAVEIPTPEPWDTGLLTHVITPSIDFRQLRILS